MLVSKTACFDTYIRQSCKRETFGIKFPDTTPGNIFDGLLGVLRQGRGEIVSSNDKGFDRVPNAIPNL